MVRTSTRREGREVDERARAHRARRLEVLSRTWAFRGCSPEELGRIDAAGTVVERPAGVVLQQAGRSVRQLVVVLEGSVIESGHGLTRTFGPDHVVGVEALARHGGPAGASAATATAVQVLVLGPAELVEVADLAGVRAAFTGPVRRASRAAVGAAARRAASAWAPAAPGLA